MHAAVIGSSLSGLSCAKALIERGVQVTVIDTGEQLDEARKEITQRMKWEPRREWDSGDIEVITENHTLKTRRLPLKLAFGSDYVYAQDCSYAPTEPVNSPVLGSLALGGFSNVWGGAVLPYRDDDIADWPISFSNLEPYYKKILADMPLSAETDALAEIFPILKPNPLPLKSLGQKQALLRDILKAKDKLTERGIYAGAPRLTVHCEASDATPGCDFCGLCLTGCPRDAIYSTSDEIKNLSVEGKIRYLPNLFVKKVKETGNGVSVESLDTSGSGLVEHNFDRVFIGAGAIGTARIMLESMDLFDTPVTMKESAKFIIPWVRFSGTEDVFHGRKNELANAFITFNSEKTLNRWVQIQVSPANILVRKKFGLESSGRFLKWLSNPFISRLMLCYGSLHSDHSPEITLTLKNQGDDSHPVLSVKSEDNNLRYHVTKNTSRLLRRNSFLFRAFPIGFAAMSTSPGASYHTGSGFPMRATPQLKTDTDTLGRPQGYKNVYLIDSTTFPSVPGTTIGLSIMANARRIASLADLA